MTDPEMPCVLSEWFEQFLSNYLQEPIRRGLCGWEIDGEPPEPDPQEELGSGRTGTVYKGLSK